MYWLYKKLINHYKIISFDIFDTLIVRDVYEPTDIFEKVGISILGDNSDGITFKDKRIDAEKIARTISNNGEVTIDDIYMYITDYDVEMRERLKAAEINYEINHCACRKSTYSLFKYALKNGKEIVLISDMYLSSEIIERMLKTCGYDMIRDKLYISNQFGVNKKSGKLFDLVIENLNVDRNSVLHFGDSFVSDILGAKKSGINAAWIPKEKLIIRYIYKLFKIIGRKIGSR